MHLISLLMYMSVPSKVYTIYLLSLLPGTTLTAMDVDRATESLPTTSKERPNFRRELYARSTDRSTVEDMADMVVHRFVRYTHSLFIRNT